MKPLAVEIATYTHLPLARGELSGRVATRRLFAVLCLISSLAVCMFWFTAGKASDVIGQTSNVLISEKKISENEITSSTTLVEFVDHLLDRSGSDHSGDEVPSPATEQPGDVSVAEDDNHKVLGLGVSFEFLVSPIEEADSKLGFAFAEPNVKGREPVTLLRGPPAEK